MLEMDVEHLDLGFENHEIIDDVEDLGNEGKNLNRITNGWENAKNKEDGEIAKLDEILINLSTNDAVCNIRSQKSSQTKK